MMAPFHRIWFDFEVRSSSAMETECMASGNDGMLGWTSDTASGEVTSHRDSVSYLDPFVCRSNCGVRTLMDE